MKTTWMALAACSVALMVAGCSGSKDTATTTDGTTPAAGKQLTIGIVFDSGGRGDKSFNDSAWAGIERAKKDFNIKEMSVESKSEKDYEANQGSLAEAGADLVIAVGLNQETALRKVSAQFPDSKFAIVDGSVEAKNVRMLKFKEEEGSFLAGYLAGLMTKTNKLGFVGGMEIPLIHKFQYGFLAGAKMANPQVEMLPAKFTGNWDDSQKGKAAATVLFSSGADIVYHAAGRAGQGVITAAKETGKFAIGVDSDQDYLAEGNVLTSMVKRVDEAVYSTIKDIVEGKYSAGESIYDLKANGVGLSEMKFTKDKVGEANLAKIEEIKKKIVDGTIKVPKSKEEYDAMVTG
ncbi:MAG: BMP family ABC transporter substrate-binding protein [Chthonomonas sp.]|nr:BMP family ABC transporter substrate-binding protein [Chthonomonas sp.]